MFTFYYVFDASKVYCIMASFKFGVALVGVLLTGFVLLQALVFLKESIEPPKVQVNRKPQFIPNADTSSPFLLGVGKSDITGYLLHNFYFFKFIILSVTANC